MVSVWKTAFRFSQGVKNFSLSLNIQTRDKRVCHLVLARSFSYTKYGWNTKLATISTKYSVLCISTPKPSSLFHCMRAPNVLHCR
jgi:hypothetical protein